MDWELIERFIRMCSKPSPELEVTIARLRDPNSTERIAFEAGMRWQDFRSTDSFGVELLAMGLKPF